jgi:hypothetical protein
MRILLVFSLFLLLIQGTSAQDRFGSGYYLSEAGDTVHGFIQYKPRYTDKVPFRSTLKSRTKELSAEQTRAFGFTGWDNFERLEFAATKDAPASPVFVNVLVSGEIDLLVYRRTFIIGSAQAGRFKLIGGKSSNAEQAMKNYQTNTGAFNILFQDCAAVKEAAQKAKISRRALVELIKDYHKCRGLPATELEMKTVSRKKYVGFFIGESFTTLKFGKPPTLSRTSYLYNSDFGSSLQPTLGAIFLVSGKHPSSTLAFQSELVYSRGDFNGTYVYTNEEAGGYVIRQTTTTAIDFSRISISAGLRATGRSNTLNPYLAIGIAGQAFLSMNSKVNQTTQINDGFEEITIKMEPTRATLAVWAAAGLKLKVLKSKAVFLDFNYENSFINDNGKITSLSSRLGFMF